MIPSTAPVVPAGRMRGGTQPVFELPGGARLRPWRTADAEVLVEAARDPEIQHWNRPGREVSVADAEAKIERFHRRWQDEKWASWAIVPAGAERPAGMVAWGDIDLRHGSAEIVYWLLPAGRGAGLMAAAVRRAVRWAFRDLGLHRLVLTHSVANPASCRVAEKTGFLLEGTMRSQLPHADGWHDEHLHALIEGDPGAGC